MGRDKAMLELDGKTLLARAVETLRAIEGFQPQDGRVEVVLCGKREPLEGADRAIVDHYPECGPLGGIEAALRDLKNAGDAEWAFFIPVDMPLLSASLIEGLLDRWVTKVEVAVSPRACLVEVDGRPQPLVSLVHRSVHGPVQEALGAGRYKVVPVLQSVGWYCTSFDQEIEGQTQDHKHGPSQSLADRGLGHETSEKPTPLSDGTGAMFRSEGPFRETYEQFMNVNTEADLIRVATLLKQRGSIIQP